MNANFHRILLVDDDFDQQFFSTHALKQVLSNRSSINLASSGDEAIAYMIGEGRFADRQNYPFPTVVITDLSMPHGDGFDVLEFMQSNADWSLVPRIVFSSSEDDDDVRTAYMLGASAYHLKPRTLAEMEQRMAGIIAYWSTSQIPPADLTGRLALTRSSPQRGSRFPQPEPGAEMKRP